MSKILNKPVALAVTLALSLLATAPRYADAVLLHFALTSSLPEADTTVAEVQAVQLTFTQVPQEEGRVIHLLDPQGELVELGAIRMDDERIMSAPVEAEVLVNGAYTVSWRGAGDDGHFVTGEYTFTLQVAEDD